MCLPIVRAIIVNYNSARLAMICAKSVQRVAGSAADVHITIVENGSTDDSREILNAELGPANGGGEIRWIDAGKNGGFGAGCNVGISEGKRQGRTDFWWLINPDAQALPGSLDLLLKAMEDEPEAGIVGGGLANWSGQLMTASGKDPCAFSEFAITSQWPSLVHRSSQGIPQTRQPADWVCGANMLIRADALEPVGGFDEQFFLYYEDLDLCRRMRSAGWKVIHEPASRVVHAVGKSTQFSVLGRWPRYFFESRCRYFLEHSGRWGLIKADAAWSLGGLLRRIYRWWDMGRTVPGFPDRFASDLYATDFKALFRKLPAPAHLDGRADPFETRSSQPESKFSDRAMT